MDEKHSLDETSAKRMGRRGPFEIFIVSAQVSERRQTLLLHRLAQELRPGAESIAAFLEDLKQLAKRPAAGWLKPLSIGLQQGLPVFATEHPHGFSLKAALAASAGRQHSLPAAAAAWIVLRLAETLEAAARPPAVVHGSLRAECVFLCFDGQVKLADFGAYRLADFISAAGMELSPEQRRGSPPDLRSDIWALGNLARHVFGKDPVGNKAGALLQRMLAESPPLRPSATELAAQWKKIFAAELAGGRQALRQFLDSLHRQSDLVSPSQRGRDADLLDPGEFWTGEEEEPTAEVEAAPRRQPAGKATPPRIAEPQSPLPPRKSAGTPAVKRESPAAPPPTGADKPTGEAAAERASPRRAHKTMAAGLALLSAVVMIIALFVKLAPENGRLAQGDGAAQDDKTAGIEPKNLQNDVGQKSASAAGKQAENNQAKSSAGGVLSVVSDPPGAIVIIDGERRGAAPTRLTGLPTDREIVLRLVAEGFRNWEQKIVLDKGGREHQVQAGLYPLQDCHFGSGWLYITTDPKGATVELDGKRFPGVTPMLIEKVCSGQNHSVRLQHIGYRPWFSNTVTIPAGEVANLDVTLQK